MNKLARASTTWTRACDKRSARLISCIHHTSEFKQYCHVGNTAQQCRLGFFQDSDFAGDVEDSKSTSGGIFCILGSHTFVPISWMCKKQTSVSHSSTEAERTSFDVGPRMDGTPALDLWSLVKEVVHCNQHQPSKTRIHPRRETCGIASCRAHERRLKPKLQPSTIVLSCFTLIVCFRTSNFLSPLRCCAYLRINEAVVKNDHQK